MVTKKYEPLDRVFEYEGVGVDGYALEDNKKAIIEALLESNATAFMEEVNAQYKKKLMLDTSNKEEQLKIKMIAGFFRGKKHRIDYFVADSRLSVVKYEGLEDIEAIEFLDMREVSVEKKDGIWKIIRGDSEVTTCADIVLANNYR